MVSPLKKARSDPKSMKGKILSAARSLFGKYGYHGTTTRMIAKEVNIDISTMYYHWGEKQDLFEAVIRDINEDIRIKIAEFKEKIHNKSLKVRVEISLDTICDYLFNNPEVSNLILNLYFSKIRNDDIAGMQIPDYLDNIAIAMGLALNEKNISIHTKTGILAVFNSVFNFIAGENIFGPMLGINHEKYIKTVKETLRNILLPAAMKEKKKVKSILGASRIKKRVPDSKKS